MSRCSNCNTEYEDKSGECDNCGGELTSNPVTEEREDYIEFYLASDTMEADLITGILADDSIHTKVRPLRDTPFPVQTNIQDGVAIAVAAHQLKEAVEVIKQAQEDEIIPDTGVFLK